MDPVYSHEECITVIRDYYYFLTQMFINSSCVLEPPPGGWPSITPESMQGTRKTEDVVRLLQHLPCIGKKRFPHVLPGCRPFDWITAGTEMMNGTDPEGKLIMSEGVEDQFGGRIPSHVIGLMYARLERDVILLDTKNGLVHWMACPDKIVQTSLPKPSLWHWELPQDEDHVTLEDAEDDVSDDEGEDASVKGRETPPISDNDGDNDDQSFDGIRDSDSNNDDSTIRSEDLDEISWGPSWPIRDFFEMLKNHCLCLNFIPRDAEHLIDIWAESIQDDNAIPEGLPEMLQGIFRKHGWPDLEKYRKEECLAEVKRELNEKYPNSHKFWPH
jgi:hypothetical protein